MQITLQHLFLTFSSFLNFLKLSQILNLINLPNFDLILTCSAILKLARYADDILHHFATFCNFLQLFLLLQFLATLLPICAFVNFLVPFAHLICNFFNYLQICAIFATFHNFCNFLLFFIYNLN